MTSKNSSSSRIRMTATVLALAAGFTLAAAAPSSAAVSLGGLILSPGTLVISSTTPDQANNVTLTCESNCFSTASAVYRVVVSNDTITVAGNIGCGAAGTFPASTTITCTATGARPIEDWSVNLGPGNDVVNTDAVCNGFQCLFDPDTDVINMPMSIDPGPGNDSVEGGNRADSIAGSLGADTVLAAAGTDSVTYSGRTDALTLDLNAAGATDGGEQDGPSGARDRLTDVESLVGGNGDDTLIGTDAANTLSGGGGNDRVQGLLGPDTMTGGAGAGDVVDYGDRSSGQPVNVSVDGVGNDGQAGESDSVGEDFEVVAGGSGGDRLAAAGAGVELRGAAGADELFVGNGGGRALGGEGNDKISGGDGADVIDAGLGDDAVDGLGGADQLLGGAGADTIEARDGVADAIDCGLDFDTVLTDPGDAEVGCEAGGSDGDRDGFSSKQDCNDANANVRPNAPEVPGNDVDENCDGVKSQEVDRDGDGFTVSQDCNDANPRIRPNAREVPGNRVDENCDKRVVPFTVPARLRIPVAWERFSASTKLTRLEVTGAPAGARVTLTCKKVKGKGKGPGCPFATKQLKVRRGKANATKLVRGARFRTGALLEIKVIPRGFLGLVRTARFTNGRNPTIADRCLRPGAKRTQRCR